MSSAITSEEHRIIVLVAEGNGDFSPTRTGSRDDGSPGW